MGSSSMALRIVVLVVFAVTMCVGLRASFQKASFQRSSLTSTVMKGDLLQILPLTRPGAFSKKGFVVCERHKIVAVTVTGSKVGFVGAPHAIGVSAMLLDIAKEGDPVLFEHGIAFAWRPCFLW